VSKLVYAVRYKCDWCGAEADGGPPRDDLPWPGVPLPDGWFSAVGTMMKRAGLTIDQLCGSCGVRPVHDLIAFLRES
jgi:hypothetical protein